MTNTSKTLAVLFTAASLVSFPLTAFAQATSTSPETESSTSSDNQVSRDLSNCLNSALAANDMTAVRACDRFNPNSPIFGQPSTAQ